MTELATDPSTDLAVEEPLHDVDAITDEVGSIDVGNFATTEYERTLHRYVRWHNALTAERARIAEQTRLMLADIDRQREGLDFVYAGLVQDITRRMLAAKGGKAKSLKTPFGTVGFRKTGGGLVITDEVALTGAARKSDAMKDIVRIYVTQTIVKAELDKYFDATGDLPPGVEVKPETDKFYVK